CGRGETVDEPQAGRSEAEPGLGLVHRESDPLAGVRLVSRQWQGYLGAHSTEGPMLNLEQFMNIRFLHKQGHSVREIARLTGHSRKTVRNLLRATRAPIPVPRLRSSKLDLYKPYLTERWQAHGLSAVRLLPEIRAQGFAGSTQIVRRFLQELKATRR